MSTAVASSNAIDLSRLPASAAVAALNYETILDAMPADLIAHAGDRAEKFERRRLVDPCEEDGTQLSVMRRLLGGRRTPRRTSRSE